MNLLRKILDRLRRQAVEPVARNSVPNEDRSSMAKLAHLFKQDEPPSGQPK